jgi:hypothetical protein
MKKTLVLSLLLSGCATQTGTVTPPTPPMPGAAVALSGPVLKSSVAPPPPTNEMVTLRFPVPMNTNYNAQYEIFSSTNMTSWQVVTNMTIPCLGMPLLYPALENQPFQCFKLKVTFVKK